MVSNIYPLQQALANRVVARLNQGHRYVALVSPMQSGKTGTIAAIARQAVNKYECVYFVTGVSDLMVREQNLVALADEPIEILDKYELRAQVQEGTVASLFAHIRPNSLLLIDEAHWGVSDTGLLATPFRHAADTAQCDIVAVSATNYPFQGSRLGCDFAPVTPTMQELHDAGYVGLHTFLDQGLVTDIPEANSFAYTTAFFEAMTAFAKAGPGYFIVRPSNHSSDNRLRKLIAASAVDSDTFDVVEWNVGTGSLFTADTFGLQPTKPTVVVIKDFLRMGKVIPVKKHIFGIWEEGGTNVQTAVQGLTGRLCGYGTGALQARIYAKKAFMQEYVRLQQAGFTNEAGAEATVKLAPKVLISKEGKVAGAPRRVEEREALALKATGNFSYHNVHLQKSQQNVKAFLEQALGLRKGVGGVYAGHEGVIWELDGNHLDHPQIPKGERIFMVQEVRRIDRLTLKTRGTMYGVVEGDLARETKKRRR